MIKTFARILLAIVLASLIIMVVTACKPTPFTGYLVTKEFTPEHMCHDDVVVQQQAYVHVPVVHHHQEVEETYVWFVANKNRVIEVHVTKELYNTRRVGEKITVMY